MNKHQRNSPLICDPNEGICEITHTTNNTENVGERPIKKAIRITYFTDPICSSCWGIEPQLRKLKLEYGDFFEIEYKMGGLLPDWNYNRGGISKPSDVAHHWDEVSQYYEMPIDGNIWIEDPLHSSYPPSIAFKAAQRQDSKKAIAFLRRIREMVFMEKKRITKWEYLEQAAIATGLDVIKLKADFEGKAQQDFKEDLFQTQAFEVQGFPTFFFNDDFGNQYIVLGFKPYQHFERAILNLLPNAQKKKIDTDFHTVFEYYPTLTSKEYALLTDTSVSEAEKLLYTYYRQNMLDKIEIKNGILWVKKTEDYKLKST